MRVCIELHIGESCSLFNPDGTELSEDVLQDFIDQNTSELFLVWEAAHSLRKDIDNN